MKHLLLVLLVFNNIISNAQLTFNVDGVVTKKISTKLPEGTSLTFTGIGQIEGSEFETYYGYVSIDTIEYKINLRDIDNINFYPKSSKEFWQTQSLKNETYSNITNNGMQYGLRNELEDDALEYLGYLERNNLIFNDAYLENYIYTLVYKILPFHLDDGRPGIISIKLLKESSPNAFIFPSGMLVITTGLLSTINSEDELVAILAHEVAHFVLDHSVININAAVQRAKRAEFWAGFSTALAATADVYLASKNEYYSPGILTMGTAILSYNIANSVIERLGLKYSRKQELEADRCAVELLEFIQSDKNALASALIKIKSVCILSGNYIALTNEGTHPSLDTRIENIGSTKLINDPNYDIQISLVNTFNAIYELNSHHFEGSLNYSYRNINNGIGTEEDYVIAAMSIMKMHDTQNKNLEALKLLQKAESLNINPTINLYKQKALVYLRLKEFSNSKNSLDDYRDNLNNELDKISAIKNPQEWSIIHNFIERELIWSSKMIQKVNVQSSKI